MKARRYAVSVVATPRRDIDLFGAATYRLDAAFTDDGPGVPVLYLSAYVPDPETYARRVQAAMAWLDDATVDLTRGGSDSGEAVAASVDTAVEAAEGDATDPYTYPDFIEDVDWSERLYVPDDVAKTDWSAWTAALLCRIELAQSSNEIARFHAANDATLKAAPAPERRRIAARLEERYRETASQVAA